MQVTNSRTSSSSPKLKIILSALLGSLVTGVAFFVRMWVVVPFGHAVSGSAFVLGFPAPYFTFVPCCQSFGPPTVTLDNSYFFRPIGFLVDVAVWEAISFGIVLAYSYRRLLISSIIGAVVTVASLLSPPIYFVAPTPALETSILRPMGFPYDYLTYYVTGLGVSLSGYHFDIIAAIADFALWFGVTFLVLGILSRERFHNKKSPWKSEIQPDVDNESV